MLERDVERLRSTLTGLYELAIGGTAVGTGLNTHPEFAERGREKIAELTGLPFRSQPNKFAALSAHDELVLASGALEDAGGVADEDRQRHPLAGLRAALRLGRTDPAGKRAGLLDHAGQGEPDAVRGDDDGLPCRWMGNDAAIAFAGSQGNFELNVFKPVIIHNFLHSVTLLTDACHGFVEHMIDGIEVDRDKVDFYVKNCLMLVTALNPKIGYDKAAKIAHTAHAENTSLRRGCIEVGYLTRRRVRSVDETGEDDKTIDATE